MNALVTGGGGFIGSALARELIVKGFRVTSFSRGDYAELRKSGIILKRGDLSDWEAVSDACDGIDIIFHVAAKAGFWGPYKDYYLTNVIGTENIIKACFEKNVKWLIYTSSASVIFDRKDIKGADESLPYPARPISFYTGTKALAEQSVLKADSSSLRTLALRPHIVLGPGDNHLIPAVLSRAKAGKLQQIGNGRNMTDISFIENVVAAHINAAEAIISKPDVSGKAYFISNGEPVVLWDFLNEILKRSGIEPVRRSISARTAFIYGALTEVYHNLFSFNKEPGLTTFLVQELSKSHWFNISAARKLLNYNPVLSNKEGLNKHFMYPEFS